MASPQEAAIEFESGLVHNQVPETWDRLVRSVRPAAMLLLIEARMGSKLRGRLNSSDVWQQTLHEAWQKRASFEGDDLGALRRWFLEIAEEHLRERVGNGNRTGVPLGVIKNDTPVRSIYAGPSATTTQEQAANDAAEASAMRGTLDSLQPELRYIVWLREFENLGSDEIAARMERPEPEVRSELRKGLIAYQHKLRGALARQQHAR